MKLLEPGRIGTMEVKNRIIMAAMGVRGLCDPDGDWGDRFRAYYEARARGGVGLITTEMTFVSRALEPVARQLFNIENDRHRDSMRRLADALHSHGCRLSIQLTAGFGRVVPAAVIDEREPPVSASENPNFYVPDFPEYSSRALTAEEAAALAESFGYAARRCREAGADCVELHGHEGYLMDQFMTALWNRRTDRYGGSREKRLTFVKEAMEAIRREAGEDFPVIFRYGVTHYLEGGRDIEEGIWIAGELEKMGASALHVDAGCYETGWWPHPPQYQPPACLAELAERVKKAVAIPVIAVGRLHYPDVAEQVLQSAKADFVAIGRGLLSEPDWVNKVASDRSNEIMPCLGCHEGCLWQMIAGEPTSCALRPLTGHETQWMLTPITGKRSLLVVGGGPAGIEAARAGAERGFDVTLWEAGKRLGGNLRPASVPPFKRDIAAYLSYLEGLVDRLGIQVVYGKRAAPEDVRACGADHVVVATGALMEPLPFYGNNTFSLIDVLSGRQATGETILIMGAGVAGCETAAHFALQGKKVILCARADDDALDTDMVDMHNRSMLLRMVRHPNISIYRGTIPVRLEQGGVIAKRQYSSIYLAADSLVFAGRMFPDSGLAEALKDMENVTAVGDCKAPGTIMDAVWSAFETIRTLP